MDDCEEAGKATKVLISFNRGQLAALDQELIPLLRKSGKKVTRSLLVRALLELSLQAQSRIDVRGIRDEATLMQALGKAISTIDE